jgi:hypothetical protein
MADLRKIGSGAARSLAYLGILALCGCQSVQSWTTTLQSWTTSELRALHLEPDKSRAGQAPALRNDAPPRHSVDFFGPTVSKKAETAGVAVYDPN